METVNNPQNIAWVTRALMAEKRLANLEQAKQEANNHQQERLIKFCNSMVDLVYWDKEPLENAIRENIELHEEVAALKEYIAQLEAAQHRVEPTIDSAVVSPAKTDQSESDSPA